MGRFHRALNAAEQIEIQDRLHKVITEKEKLQKKLDEVKAELLASLERQNILEDVANRATFVVESYKYDQEIIYSLSDLEDTLAEAGYECNNDPNS